MPEAGQRQIIVTELKKITSGTRKGKPFSLYQVRATYPDGRVIPNMDLRTFEELPVNQVITVRVTAYDSPQWGRSYTVWHKTNPQQQQQSQPTQQAPQNGNVIQGILARLKRIEEHLGLSGQRPTPQAAGPPPIPTGELPPDPSQ